MSVRKWTKAERATLGAIAVAVVLVLWLWADPSAMMYVRMVRGY